MKTVVYIENQLANLHMMFLDIVADFNEQEWLSRAAPGQNRVGFIIWHIPRTQDNVVQVWIRGGSELFHRPEWAHWQALRPFGIGTGVTLAEADEVATKVQFTETLEYANQVHREILTWLRQLADSDLDQVPDAPAHLASYTEYQTIGFREMTDRLRNRPVWDLLLRPCIGHLYRHLGELQLAKAVLRSH